MSKKTKNIEQSENKALHIGDVTLRFKLRLNIDEWGNYKKGDEDTFYIKLLDEQNGLAKFPINKQWDIVSCEVVRCFGCEAIRIMNNHKIDRIDEVLAQCEDILHGRAGEEVTEARKLLSQLQEVADLESTNKSL